MRKKRLCQKRANEADGELASASDWQSFTCSGTSGCRALAVGMRFCDEGARPSADVQKKHPVSKGMRAPNNKAHFKVEQMFDLCFMEQRYGKKRGGAMGR